MATNRIIGGGAALIMAALALPTRGNAQEYTETTVYGIADFGASSAGLCCSSCKSHAVHTDSATAFQNTFLMLQALGLWNESQARNNTSARGSYFTDSTKAGTCGCSAADTTTDYGADDADVVYVHTHGRHSASATGGYYSALEMGDAHYACEARTDLNMLWGNGQSGDLGFAVIKACQSGDYDVWYHHGYRAQYSTTDSSFRVWNAFHGDSSCGHHVTSYVGAYSLASMYDGVGETWLDVAYDDDAYADKNGEIWDDCPVSIVSGATASQREDMYEHGGWLDRRATGDKTSSTYFFIAGCSPKHGRVLPSG